MPFQRTRYPPHWPELARQAKATAGWRCTGCGLPHGALAISERNCLFRVVLAACHLDHDPANLTPRLTVFCQPCHLRYDAFARWRSRRLHARRRAVAAGQLEFGAEASTPL